MANPTVFVIDDDHSVLKAMTRFLTTKGYEVHAYSSPADFLTAHDPEVSGCAVMDVSMPGLNGLELQSALISSNGTCRPVIFISGQSDIPISVRAMKQGAVDFLTKPVDEMALVSAIEAALDRDNTLRAEQLTTNEAKKLYEQLTRREREVFSHVVAGRLNKQIASDLGIAEKTVKLHRGRTMVKMKARSLADLVRLSERITFVLAQGR